MSVLAFMASGCFPDRQDPSPTDASSAQGSLGGDLLPEPRDFSSALQIDVPASPPAYAADDALVAAVREAEGRVHIGFKDPGIPPLRQRAFAAAGDQRHLRAVVGPVQASQVGQARRFLATQGAEIVRTFSDLPFLSAIIPPESAPSIRRHPLIDYVEPLLGGAVADGGWDPESTEIDDKSARPTRQTVPASLVRIRAPEAWSDGAEGSGAHVVIIDTGVSGGLSHHPDLPQLDSTTCLTTAAPFEDRCLEDTESWYDGYSHGTKVAGLVVGETHGVAPSADWTSIRACTPDHEEETCELDSNALIQALVIARENARKDVVVMAWSDTTSTGIAGLSTAVAAAYSIGDLLVSSIGNTSEASELAYPQAYSQVIGVSGLGPGEDTLATGSKSGSDVEISAPFQAVTIEGTSGTTGGGATSYSTAFVGGVAALMWGENTGWSNVQVRAALKWATEWSGFWNANLPDHDRGYGIIDACFAVEAGCESIHEPLDASLTGPEEVRSTEQCSWLMTQIGGGRRPLTFQWSGALSGSQHFVMGSVSEDDWLNIQIDALDGQQFLDSIWIEVDEEAAGCEDAPVP